MPYMGYIYEISPARLLFLSTGYADADIVDQDFHFIYTLNAEERQTGQVGGWAVPGWPDSPSASLCRGGL